MVFASNLGYPRIGPKRRLKSALESFWSGKSSEEDLVAAGKELRLAAWKFQQSAGLDFIPSNDFSFYDHVLDTAAMVGAVPARFRAHTHTSDLTTYFLMARGKASDKGNLAVPAMEMTKWFNTNYHFIVPEIADDQRFELTSRKCVNEFLEAKAAGIETRPVVLGPVSFLRLARREQSGNDRKHLESLTEVYLQLLTELQQAGAQWIQIDEPCLALDLEENAARDFQFAYQRLTGKLSILLTSYFSSIGRNLPWAMNLPVQGIHLDLVNGQDDLTPALELIPSQMLLSAGVVDGHNVWRCDLEKTIELLGDIAEKIGPERLIVAPSCSLLHVPMDVDMETTMDKTVRSLLSFANQKVREISVLTDALCCGLQEIDPVLKETSSALRNEAIIAIRKDATVEHRLTTISDGMLQRVSPFEKRIKAQQKQFDLPNLPTTTIGSFPQTKAIREARKSYRTGNIDGPSYEQAMRTEIANNISIQENIGLDVFVHGEPERTDMVEYFAEMLSGMAVTQHGWVQSYGSRCVKPPIIYGAVSRPQPMTVDWAKYAQSLTRKPVKGMLTGPVTILQWSFVRDDQPRAKTCMELALAIRDEVTDLEAAGINIIQIDEPAIREGLPLKRSEWEDYLKWSVDCFKLASSSVVDSTQIHTHMCYSEFGDMVDAIANMDADVISIEAARSSMDLLNTLRETTYPNAIGPGVWDIHSPRIPGENEVEELLRKALNVIPVDRLWVNPDCGLKTRNWEEVIPSLKILVQAAQRLRTASAKVSAATK